MTYAGAGGSPTRIAQTVLSTNAASIVFGSLPTTYKHLMLELVALTSSASKTYVRMTVNGLSANYQYQHHENPTSTGSVTVYNGSSQASFQVGTAAGSTTMSSLTRITIPNYTSGTMLRAVMAESWHYDAAGAAAYTSTMAGWQSSGTALTSLTLTLANGSFTANTTATLSGVV